jgi:uncharacterized protein YjcR
MGENAMILRRMNSIEGKLEDQSRKMDGIAEALSRIAVQDERIKKLEKQREEYQRKWDAFFDPDGTFMSMKNFQASCPRSNIKLVWLAVIPIGFTELMMGIAILKLFMS